MGHHAAGTTKDNFPANSMQRTMRSWLLGPLTLFLLLCKINAGADGGVYEDGQHKVNLVEVDSKSSPKPLIVAMPKDEGVYPVLQFHHGWLLRNSCYRQLISHVASHGFIVVAPQMYTWSGSDATKEIEEAITILNWMRTGLVREVPGALAKPNFEKVALVGHSRGGKVVFGVALEVRNKGTTTMQQYSAVVVLDPLDGTGQEHQTMPHILPFSNNSLNLGVPTLIVGTGLGPNRKFFDILPPCAPKGMNHGEFYNDVAAPAFHFVASQHGHMDFLDDDCNGICLLAYFLCRNGPDRKFMRRFAGGISIAFLRAALFNNTSSLEYALTHPKQAPVPLDPPQCKSHKVAECMDQLKVKTLGTIYGLDNH